MVRMSDIKMDEHEEQLLEDNKWKFIGLLGNYKFKVHYLSKFGNIIS